MRQALYQPVVFFTHNLKSLSLSMFSCPQMPAT
ncbi:hypothetical protein BN439_3351 [Erwinia amylovora Ea644]|uniref:Uncharacterized protein n=3 Tax=Erwinia amylovora TaxID=552 RepID=A0A831A3S3_ERWAM|nr:hypothetical protein EaACW_3130 [Erwinia amylovora ACW56400]QJQ53213.1 hypothetical protein EHX00_0506 [Erwinia amylovora]CBA23024.1 hypothetical protein predicted by Glimmer/Critica [Erwinia amylovora CFBP1430]CBX81990.1 hypothetical protein predicted by Glimmer/Critica [Erwinia amylovora ATCC BAA-2158]CCO79968.1 hypothetical protein BN432_3195 [Erwinia amylovora Ea356]CCO83773.1 hypothetical protein BN433_3221 [Erwinia amylovora Ea266]CCO87535.1 hypothetical protein BN434_3171 [Erwinia a